MSRGRHGWITHALFVSFCVPRLMGVSSGIGAAGEI
jgi:hypothetical protein